MDERKGRRGHHTRASARRVRGTRSLHRGRGQHPEFRRGCAFFPRLGSIEKRPEAIAQHLPVLHLAFPDNEDAPALALQGITSQPIALDVASDLLHPETCVGLRSHLSSRAIMAMPEAAMDKDDPAARRKNEIRFSRKIAAMKAVTIAFPV